MQDLTFRDHRRYLVHLIRALSAHGPSAPADLYEEVADLAGVTAEERLVPQKTNPANPVYTNRIQFARQGLVDAGAVLGSSEPGWRRGIWELTPQGRDWAAMPDEEGLFALLNERAVHGARERAKAREESRALAGLAEPAGEVAEGQAPEQQAAESSTDEGDPSIRDLVDRANEAAMAAMLDHIRGMNETAFEHLVGDVLKKALGASSVRITQKTKDGGIDGVLAFDALGMRIAVFEAKRYADGNGVSRPQIDAFATAGRRRRAAHKVFVTSSHFSKDCISAAKDEDIRLIDGLAFVELMAQHGVGLRPKDTFVVYEIDAAWAVEDAE